MPIPVPTVTPPPPPPVTTTSTTLAHWIAEARDHLDGSRTEDANQLGATYAPGSGTVTLKNELGNVAPGTHISVGLNVLLVTAVNALTKTASVVGGQRGSVDTTETIGTLVRVNPRFTDHQIVREINRHLATLSAPKVGLFTVAATNLAYTATVEGYNLPVTSLLRVLEVRRQTYGPSFAWPTVETTLWDVLRSAPTTMFPSGVSLRVRGGHTGLAVQVVYAKTFTPIAPTLTTLVSTTGVSIEQEDIPPLGAAIRLMSGREIGRNSPSSQGDTRRSNEVPAGMTGASYRGLVALWQERVAEESSRLRAMYPVAK